MIGSRVAAIGERQKRVRLQTAGAVVPDGEGGYTQGVVALIPPATFARIRPASQGDLERILAGTPTTTASHLVEMPWHPQVDVATQLLVEDYPRPDRVFEVVFVGNPDERNADLILVCAEVL